MKDFIFSQLIKSDPFPRGNDSFEPILNVIFMITGALALLMLVIGGLRYTISGGAPDKVSESKRMIVYSLVGLVIVALAASIVNYVLVRL